MGLPENICSMNTKYNRPQPSLAFLKYKSFSESAFHFMTIQCEFARGQIQKCMVFYMKKYKKINIEHQLNCNFHF